MPDMEEDERKERISQSRSATAKTTGGQNHRETNPCEKQGVCKHADPEIATADFEEDEIDRLL